MHPLSYLPNFFGCNSLGILTKLSLSTILCIKWKICLTFFDTLYAWNVPLICKVATLQIWLIFMLVWASNIQNVISSFVALYAQSTTHTGPERGFDYSPRSRLNIFVRCVCILFAIPCSQPRFNKWTLNLEYLFYIRTSIPLARPTCLKSIFQWSVLLWVQQ